MPTIKKCQYCNKTFKVYLSKTNIGKFCSSECYHSYQKIRKRKEYWIKCKCCGKSFKVYLHKIKTAKYCSIECKDIDATTKVSRKCVVCGKEFMVQKCRKDLIKNCSLKCARKSSAKSRIGLKASCATKKKLSDTLKEQFKNGRNTWNKGKIGVCKGVRGSKSNLWKGGTSKLWWRLISSHQYKKWRLSVYQRDNFTCQKCGSKKVLEAHHLKAKAVILRNFLSKKKTKNIKEIFKNCPEIIDINNGLTLCRSCHKKTDNYAGKNKKI